MGKKSKSSSQATTVTTPSVPDWIQKPYQNVTSSVQGLLGQTPTTILANANQTGAWARAAQGSGAGAAIQPLTNYTPDKVTAGLLSNIDVTPFLNPYTQNVIDAGVTDLDRARRIAINNNSANATRSMGGNAFMSDRAGVADAETNRGFLDSVGNLTANLRNAGYNTALGTALDVAKTNIGNTLGADQFNVNSGLAGASQRLAAANALGDNARADTALQAAAGEQQRAVDTENNPTNAYLSQLEKIMALLNGVPIGAFTGATVDQKGSGKSSSSGLSLGFGPNGFSFGIG